MLRTDGRTDGSTDVKTVYSPQTKFARGIITLVFLEDKAVFLTEYLDQSIVVQNTDHKKKRVKTQMLDKIFFQRVTVFTFFFSMLFLHICPSRVLAKLC